MRFRHIVFATSLACLAAPAVAQTDEERCMNRGGAYSADVRIASCTALLGSGGLDTANRAATLNNRGIGYRDRRDFTRAIADLDEAVRLDPAAGHLDNRGLAYRAQGNAPRGTGAGPRISAGSVAVRDSGRAAGIRAGE